MCSNEKSVMKEVQKVQDIIRHTYHRINVLEKKLNKDITIEKRDVLEADLTSAKSVLKNNEEKLLLLRKSNTKSFMIVSCIIFIIFLIYGIYLMIFNPY